MDKVLRVVWGNQKGFVFLSTKDRKTGRWEDHPFEWPRESEDIDEFIYRNEDKDLYWAPVLFKDKRRREELAKDPSYLYADLDAVPPGKCKIKPSIAWQSSPGRYQALWFLTENLAVPKMLDLNKRLTYFIGADKSGWDITQVLRVPGTLNYKYVDIPRGKLLWLKKVYYDPEGIDNELPYVSKTDKLELDEEIEDSDLKEAIWPYRKIIGPKLWEMLFTPDSEIKEGERSDRLWELECRLIESSVPISEVFKIVKACPWNKYRGRADEDKRILTEVLKAEAMIRRGPIVSGDEGIPWVSYANFLGRKIVGPGWLIEGIWGNRSHGMIAGEPKTYKSTIATEVAVSVASGYPMWDQFKVHQPGPVMLLQEENPAWVVQDRVMKIAYSKGLINGEVYKMRRDDVLKINFPKTLPLYIANNFGFDFTRNEHRESLEAKIEEIRPVLLILDPLYLMLGDVDENSAQELRKVLIWLIKMKENYHTSIMILHHWNKGGKSERGGQRMLGSTTLHAWVESAIYTSIKDVDKGGIIMEREFRSFMKPPLMAVDMKMSDTGDDPFYQVTMGETDIHGTDREKGRRKLDRYEILQHLRTHGSLTTGELKAIFPSAPSLQSTRHFLNKMVVKGLLSSPEDIADNKGRSWFLTDKGIDKLEQMEKEKE